MLYNYADTAFASPALPPLPSPVEGALHPLLEALLVLDRAARAVRVSDLGLHARALYLPVSGAGGCFLSYVLCAVGVVEIIVS